MKRLFLAFFMLLHIVAAAQDIEVPMVVSVTVNTSGHPVIRWQMAAPSSVDGYIIKRLIVDGQGVISGTWNNVAVIEGGHVMEYTDDSDAYGTSAKPGIRPESYRVSAYRKSGDHTFYSLMSDELSTLVAQGRYDHCTQQYTISCDALDGAESYRMREYGSGDVVAQASAPSISHAFADHKPVRRLAMECVLPGGAVMGSPVMEIDATSDVAPDLISISSVSLGSDAKSLSIGLMLSPSPSTSRAVLIREAASGTDTLELPNTSLDDYLFDDADADASEQNLYAIVAYNACGQEIARSPGAANICLGASIRATEHSLIWNIPSNAKTAVVAIDDSNSGSFRDLMDIDIDLCDYVHDIGGIMAADEQFPGRFRYQIRYVLNNGKEAFSNIAEVVEEPRIYIPNALNPESEIDDNRIFRPVANFLSDFQMSVFNKRGMLLFQTSEIGEGWDGRYRTSKLCPRDSYVYVISFTDAQGRRHEKKGFVSLVY